MSKINGYRAGVFGLLVLAGAISWAQETTSESNPMCITLDEQSLSVYNQGKMVLCYRYGDVAFKGYVQELFTPGGVNILRDSPHDHVHHHALMYAVTIDGVNFWEEQQLPGKQVHRSWCDSKIDQHNKRPRARITEKIDWVNPPTKQVMLKEERTIEAVAVNELGGTLVNWTGEFKLPPGKEQATIGGGHYHGLGMRFLESMDKGKEKRFFNASGKAGEVYRGTEKLVSASWCAFSAKADGKPVTVAMFAHPDNVRYPATWFTMTEPFVYLSATMEVYKNPYILQAGEKLVLRYGVMVWDGSAGEEKIGKAYQNWIKNFSQTKTKPNKETDND
ncbi:MAG: PmoA family protein [Sedimentisphaerales bacterium]|nr:PmoA family protein [Sedimentisphaerales bacterium]